MKILMDLSSNLVPKKKQKKKKKKRPTTWLDDKENPRMNPHTKTKLIERKGEKNHIDTIIYFYYFCARWDFT